MSATEQGGEGGLCLVRVGPTARAEVGIEDDARTAGARPAQSIDENGAAARAVERERHSREINMAIAGKRRAQGARLGQDEEVAGGSLVPPVRETALATMIGLDNIEPRQAPFESNYRASADTLGCPRGQHLLAPRVVAERGEVVDGYAKTGEVNRRIERVAAEAPRHAAVGVLRELDHAFADGRDAWHWVFHPADR
jgi:hypothetical protein